VRLAAVHQMEMCNVILLCGSGDDALISFWN